MNNDLIPLFYQAEDYFFRSISRECLDFDDNACLYITGLDSEYLNPFRLLNNILNIKDVLNECIALTQKQNVKWIINISEHVMNKNLESTLNQMSFKFDLKYASMFINLAQYNNTHSNNNIIKNTNDNLNDWMMPLIGAFESTFDQTDLYRQRHQKALNNKANFHHFTLYENNLPVASLTLSINNNTAHIDDVGTSPTSQGKGYATSLMHIALSEAIQRGATHCFLEASASGLSLYQKIGFNTLFTNYIYKSITPNHLT